MFKNVKQKQKKSLSLVSLKSDQRWQVLLSRTSPTVCPNTKHLSYASTLISFKYSFVIFYTQLKCCLFLPTVCQILRRSQQVLLCCTSNLPRSSICLVHSISICVLTGYNQCYRSLCVLCCRQRHISSKRK